MRDVLYGIAMVALIGCSIIAAIAIVTTPIILILS